MAGIPRAVLEHFRGVPLFSAVSKRDLRAIVSAADEFDEPAGKVLVREGDLRRELFVLVSGTVSVSRGGRRLRTLGPGDFFGEIALLSGGPRTATVTVTSDVRLMMLAPAQFESVLDAEPGVRRAVLHALGERLRTSGTKSPD
jgi:CRP/FNR family transcriptional regulator, cyclic AMP receptor protein